MSSDLVRALGTFAFLFAFGARAFAQVQMPDPSQMAGRAIPAPELPNGTVSVRVVREQLGNNIAGQEVVVVAGGEKKTAKTDEAGRAQVTGFPGGASATAEAVVDGERLTSMPFEVPATGGIRVILISGLEAAAARRQQEEAEALKAPASKGIVVFGGDTRFIFEFQNDALRVFYLLDIMNTARTRVDVGGPLIIDLPEGAVGAAVLQGSSPAATAQGDKVIVTGPFAPGTTSVQIAYRLLYSGHTATIRQRFPAAVQSVEVIAERAAGLEMTSSQFTNRREVRSQDGAPLIHAVGGALPAGTDLVVELTNLPNHAAWPRQVALALAALVLAGGAWFAFGSVTQADAERRRLAARRESLYGELAKLEQQHRAGRVEAGRYQTKRRQLVSELERVYGELDGAPEPAA